jgi:hypothetical protein
MAEIIFLGTSDTTFNPQVLRNSPDTKLCDLIRRRGKFVEDPDNTPFRWTRSGIHGQNKWTENADGCLVSVVLGETAEGINLGILAHLTPAARRVDSFLADYPSLLSTLKRRSPNNMFAAVAGGRVYGDFDPDWDPTGYYRSREAITKIHRDVLDIETDILRPKMDPGKTNVYVHTQRRMIYVLETGNRNSQAGLTLLPFETSKR